MTGSNARNAKPFLFRHVNVDGGRLASDISQSSFENSSEVPSTLERLKTPIDG